MNSWARKLDKVVRSYDSCLYVQETMPGRCDIYRKSKFGCNPPNFICSLTDTWGPKGRPVEYSQDVVLNRLKAHDLWRDDGFMERYIKEKEKEQESKDRARRNTVESFLYDFRRQFAKATNDINTSTLEKIRPKGEL